MTWFLLALVIFGTIAGDLLKASAMRGLGARRDVAAAGVWGAVVAAATSPRMGLSIAGYAVSFFGFMALVSITDLSFAVPATAAGYVAETLLARFLLGETISARRWAGACLVAVGVALVGG